MLHTVVRLFLRVVFRVEVRGSENYPVDGQKLVIANHTSWLDAALLAAFLPDRPIFAGAFADRRVDVGETLPELVTSHSGIDPAHPLSLKTLCACVEQGDVVAIFPEGRLSTTGGLMKVYDGAGFIAEKTGAQIVSVHIEGAHLSVFTRLAGKYKRQWFPRITLTISPPRTPCSKPPVAMDGPRSSINC